MAEYQKTIITNAGISVLNRVLASKATMTFTRAVSSTADLSDKTEAELRSMTSLSNIMQNGICSRYDIHSQNMVSLDLVFTNEGLGNSYLINTVGLYAKPSDSSTEILYAIARAGKDSKGNSLAEQMPAYVDSKLAKFTISLYTQVGQSSSVSVSITDEGVVKSINSLTPDKSGNVIVDTSNHAKAIQEQLNSGKLYIPLLDSSGNPLTDESGNVLLNAQYLPKTVSINGGQKVEADSSNNINLQTYTKAQIDSLLDNKADALDTDTPSEADQRYGFLSAMLIGNQIMIPLVDTDGNPLLDESGNAMMAETHMITSINGQTAGADGSIVLDDYYTKQAINNWMETKASQTDADLAHRDLQAQIDANLAKETADKADTDAHLKADEPVLKETDSRTRLNQASVVTNTVTVPLLDSDGGALTDGSGNVLTAQKHAVLSINGVEALGDGDIHLDYYTKQEINNKLDSIVLMIEQLRSQIKGD